MIYKKDTLRIYFCFVIMCVIVQFLVGQTTEHAHMEKLNFMVGEWVGISKSYKNDTIAKQVPAYEKISYKLDANIITIDLVSQTLQLHTVIYYDKKDHKYYYNPYYKGGAGRYEAEFKDDKFIVWPTRQKRFIFHLTSEGNFQEYGEQLIDGKWVKYFEDNFKKVL